MINIEILQGKNPFRTFNNKSRIVEFYYLEDLNVKTDSKTEPIIFDFYDKDKKLIILVEKSYYKIVDDFFSDEMLPNIFNLWLQNKKTSTLSAIVNMSQISGLPIMILFFFLNSNFIVQIIASIAATWIILFTIFVSIFFKRKIKTYRKAIEETMGDERNKAFQKRLIEFYKKRRNIQSKTIK